MAKASAAHNIVPITLTLIFVVIITTLRGAIAPTEAEMVQNVATPIGSLLQRLAASVPTISSIAWTIAVIYSGLCIGRCGVRFSIYPTYTVLGIPILGIVATGIMISNNMLLSAVMLVVATLATKYMLRYIMVTESYGDLSLAMLYFGVLPMIYAPTAILYPALPLAMLLIKANWRDWLTATLSLLFPLFALCYWSWCGGEGFTTPVTQGYAAILTQSGFDAWTLLSLASLGILVVTAAMVLCAIAICISDRYSLNGRARVAMRFNIVMILLAVATLLLPSTSVTSLALLAIPTSSLIPLIFIRMRQNITRIMWRVLLIMVAINVIILIFI